MMNPIYEQVQWDFRFGWDMFLQGWNTSNRDIELARMEPCRRKHSMQGWKAAKAALLTGRRQAREYARKVAVDNKGK